MVRMLVLMGVALHILAAGHDEDAVLEAHDVDLGSIKLRQYGSGDHLVDRAEGGMTISQIEDPVESAEQRVQVMSAEQYRDPDFALKGLRQLHDLALIIRIEADQRLVEQQQPRPADQRLSQQQALALATRDFGDRAPRQPT